MTRKEIAKVATAFCEKHKINQYPVNIVSICESLGFKVFEEYLPHDVSGFIVDQPNNLLKYSANKVIVVNLSDTPKRRRFTIAHELAHYVLHKKEDDKLYAHRDSQNSGKIETEADTFASNILMPEDLVKDAVKQFKKEAHGRVFLADIITYISNEFAVSPKAAEIRLEQIGIG